MYAKEPISYHEGIPIFSKSDEFTDNYERISTDHLEHFRQHGENPFIPEDIWSDAEQSTIALVRKYARPGDVILDVGVGMGRLLEHFPTLRRYGVDISLGYLAVAKSKGIEVSFALAEELPFQEQSFDLVVCTDVLEHVLDLNLCSWSILSVLKPNGTLIVRVPYREDLSQYLEPTYPYKYVHLRNFDESSLRLHFEKVMGCRVVDITMAGYARSSSRLRHSLPIPGWRTVAELSMSRLESRIPSLYRAMLPRVYRPIEVSIAVARA